jgi:hypothetical protein
MNQRRSYTGVNIQFPISRLILEGKKTVETRSYPIPKKYIGEPLLFIETPGKLGKFESRIVGKIVFGESFCYETPKQFYSDLARHQVSKESPWRWKEGQVKWGWPIESFEIYGSPKPAPKRKGIVFTLNIKG